MEIFVVVYTSFGFEGAEDDTYVTGVSFTPEGAKDLAQSYVKRWHGEIEWSKEYPLEGKVSIVGKVEILPGKMDELMV